MKHHFTVIANYPSGSPGVFRVVGRGYKQVRASFEKSGFTILAMDRDVIQYDREPGHDLTTGYNLYDAFEQKGWTR